MDIGKIKQVPLREIWKREDSDFTVWLENNIDYLNDVLDFEVSIEEREKRVGSFSLDLYGDDGHAQAKSVGARPAWRRRMA